MLSVGTAPVCRGGCHESSLGTVGRVHNTPLVPARPPGRSTEPQLQSGYNQLHEQLGKNKQIWSSINILRGRVEISLLSKYASMCLNATLCVLFYVLFGIEVVAGLGLNEIWGMWDWLHKQGYR